MTGKKACPVAVAAWKKPTKRVSKKDRATGKFSKEVSEEIPPSGKGTRPARTGAKWDAEFTSAPPPGPKREKNQSRGKTRWENGDHLASGKVSQPLKKKKKNRSPTARGSAEKKVSWTLKKERHDQGAHPREHPKKAPEKKKTRIKKKVSKEKENREKRPKKKILYLKKSGGICRNWLRG